MSASYRLVPDTRATFLALTIAQQELVLDVLDSIAENPEQLPLDGAGTCVHESEHAAAQNNVTLFLRVAKDDELILVLGIEFVSSPLSEG